MRAKTLIILVSLLIVIIAISGCTQNQQINSNKKESSLVTDTQTINQPQIEGTYNIEISNFAFNPSEIKIKRGETVVWINRDSAPHTVTSDSGNEINSPQLSNEQVYSHSFSNTGTFNYYCSVHPSMKATVIVE